MPKVEDYSKRTTEVAGWKVNLVSYKLGNTYQCTVDNVSPGAWLAKTQGATKKEAEEKALERAQELLSKTRKFPLGKTGG